MDYEYKYHKYKLKYLNKLDEMKGGILKDGIDINKKNENIEKVKL